LKINSDECSTTTTTNSNAGELYPPSSTNLIRGHSRQASKSSVCSNKSTVSVNSTNHQEKNHLRLVLLFSKKDKTNFA
jgi:hypothetical protein